MEYLTIKEAIDYTGKSESTLRGVIRGIKTQRKQTFEGVNLLKFDTLVNRSKKIYILKAYLDHIYNLAPSKNTYQDNTLNDRYIDRLEKELDNKQKEIDNFLELEAQIIERFGELQEALKRTQYQLQQQTQIAQERLEKLELLEEKKKTVEVENIEGEQVEEEQDLDEKEIQSRLSKKREEVLRSKMKTKNFYDYL